jgi:hypothetical protein
MLLQMLRGHVGEMLKENSAVNVAADTGKDWLRGYDDWKLPEAGQPDSSRHEGM